MALTITLTAVGVIGGLIVWGLFESQWTRLRTIDVRVAELPAELEGLSIIHLSDFHLGARSLAARAVDQAVDWAATLDPDLIVITGDLLSHPRGTGGLVAALDRLEARHGVIAVLGNHDVAVTRDPFSSPAQLDSLEEHGVTLLRDQEVVIEMRQHAVSIAGHDSRTHIDRSVVLKPPPSDASLRLLVSHFPSAVDRVNPGTYQLVLAGHMHGGQIAIPLPGRKILLAHPRARYRDGVCSLQGGATTLVVSAGLGTTFVPFRFLARPEATELRLRRGA